MFNKMFKGIAVSLGMIATVYANDIQAAAADISPVQPLGIGAQLSATGKDAAPDQARTIERLMAASGANEMIEQLAALAAAGFGQRPPPQLQREDYDNFKSTFLQAFDATKIRHIVVDYLNRHYDATAYDASLALLNTPLAQHMAALEIQAMAPESQQEMMRFAKTTLSQATPARLAQVQRLDDAVQTSKTILNMQTMMAKTMIENMNNLVHVEQRIPEQEIAQMMEQMRREASGYTRQYTKLQYLYTYRSVTDEELDNYIALHESASGRHLTQLFNDAWMNVFERLSAELGEQLGQRISDEPSKKAH